MEEYCEENDIDVRMYNKSPFDFLSFVENDSIHCCLLQSDEIDDLYCEELYRKMKRGGTILVFTNTKKIHTVGTMFCNNKFIVRDVLAWVNPSAQATSFGLKHILKSNQIEEHKEISGKRTLKLRNCFLPIMLIQKPIMGVKTLVHNQITNGCGLMNETRTVGGNLSSNIINSDFNDGYDKHFLIPRPLYPHSEYVDSYVKVINHLLNTFTHKGNTILDMTMNDGAGLYSSLILRRNYIGNEFSKDKYKKIKEKLDDFVKDIPKMRSRFYLEFP